MKIDIVKSEIKQTSTTTKPNKFKIEIIAIGNEWDTERFYHYVSRYELLNQRDLTKIYYK